MSSRRPFLPPRLNSSLYVHMYISSSPLLPQIMLFIISILQSIIQPIWRVNPISVPNSQYQPSIFLRLSVFFVVLLIKIEAFNVQKVKNPSTIAAFFKWTFSDESTHNHSHLISTFICELKRCSPILTVFWSYDDSFIFVLSYFTWLNLAAQFSVGLSRQDEATRTGFS